MITSDFSHKSKLPFISVYFRLAGNHLLCEILWYMLYMIFSPNPVCTVSKIQNHWQCQERAESQEKIMYIIYSCIYVKRGYWFLIHDKWRVLDKCRVYDAHCTYTTIPFEIDNYPNIISPILFIFYLMVALDPKFWSVLYILGPKSQVPWMHERAFLLL